MRNSQENTPVQDTLLLPGLRYGLTGKEEREYQGTEDLLFKQIALDFREYFLMSAANRCCVVWPMGLTSISNRTTLFQCSVSWIPGRILFEKTDQ